VRRLVPSTSRHFQLLVSATPCGARVAVRWSVTSSPSGSRCGSSLELEPTDQGAARSVFDCLRRLFRAGHTKTTRGPSSRLTNSRCSCDESWGLPDIHLAAVCLAQCSLRCLFCRQSGGDEETRTPDPLLAKEMLFQLSYVPLLVDSETRNGGRFWTRTRDLCLIRAVL
jgi:hypothetical protein